jgi:hypothetical protein
VTDPRLQEWLERVRALLAMGDAECLACAESFYERRRELVRLLEADACAPVSQALADQLRDHEVLLRRRLEALLEGLRAQLARVRDLQRANEGYRPQRLSVAAYVSRQV